MATIDLGSYLQPLSRYNYVSGSGSRGNDKIVVDLGKYSVYQEGGDEGRLGYFTTVSRDSGIFMEIGTWDPSLMKIAVQSKAISECGHREALRYGSRISLPVYYRDGLYQLYGGGSYRGLGCVSWAHVEIFIYHFYRLSSFSVRQGTSTTRVRQGVPTVHETVRQAADHILRLSQLRMRGDVYYLGEGVNSGSNNVPSSIAGTADEVVDYYEKHKDDLRTLISLWN